MSLRPQKKLFSAFVCQTRRYSAPGDGSIPAAKQKYVSTSGTYPKGFLAGSAFVGVKASNTKFDDLALIVSEKPCAAAAVFTKNKFQAAPVTVTREMLQNRKGDGIRAVIVNSGCANAVTGLGGIEDARAMGTTTDAALPDPATTDDGNGTRSIVMSTGVIGQRLPISKILARIPTAVSNLGATHDHWHAFARAICTTDTFPKLLSRTFTLPSYPGTTFSLAGTTKGAGMIHPNMATLLSVICTDAPITPAALHPLLAAAVDRSFNSISIDGDTSTNDTCALLANGAAVPAAAWSSPVANNPHSDDYQAFLRELTALTTDLAHLIVRDGEGATKFVAIRVLGAPEYAHAHRLARTIATSALVKTALYGKDANWGRILCAVGYADGVPERVVDPTRVSVSFVPAASTQARETPVDGELRLLVDGEPQQVDEEVAARMLEEEDLEILIRLNGEVTGEECVFWTCDFSHEYVTINGDYRT
ncbi:hypothetical protein FH972_023607 [Carpinus fangiana]|uniref:Arginine biosynthesis bifunctional protein ArgJ, chloroplastic n=1 Tax=Carpinus fangiana TaxID=176857 RepID=A0A5N6KWA5_9ROSI|nr:hypothetical protein FH972_023607 [Carpinus fangiana]